MTPLLAYLIRVCANMERKQTYIDVYLFAYRPATTAGFRALLSVDIYTLTDSINLSGLCQKSMHACNIFSSPYEGRITAARP